MRRVVFVLTIHFAIFPIFLQAQRIDDERVFLRMAQSYERAGDYQNAKRIYERLYQNDPGNFSYFDGLRRNLMQLREYDQAIRLTEIRLRETPRDVNLSSILGGMYYTAGERERAFDLWEQLLDRERSNLAAYQRVAQQMLENRLIEPAIDVYQRGRKNIGQPYLFAMDLAFLYASTMNYRAATREYLLHLENSPQQLTFVQSRMSMYVFRNGGLRQAIDVTEEKAARRKDDISLHRLLAWLYREANDFEKAYQVYRHLDKIQNARGGELFSFAQTAFREREYDVASRAYKEILDTYPQFEQIPSVRFGYAQCLEVLVSQKDSLYAIAFTVPPAPIDQRVAEMRSSFDRVLNAYSEIVRDYERTPVGGQALYRIGVLKFNWYFDLDGALETLQEVARLYSRGSIYMDAVATMGDIYIVKGMLDNALEQYERLITSRQVTDEYKDRAMLRRAEIAFFTGEFDSALEMLTELSYKTHSSYANDAIALKTFLLENREPALRGVRSDDALILYSRAMHQKRQQRYSEAIATLEHIVEEFPRALLVDDALLTIGDLYYAMQRFEDSLHAYSRILELGDGSILNDKTLMRMAETYQYGTKNTNKAIELYEQLLIDYPRSMYAQEARKRIRLLRGDRS